MELALQFGYGMMEHTRRLLDAWDGGTVLLSPRDLEREQLVALGRQLGESGGNRILLDPQFYLPRADHERLTSHEYWPSEYETDSFQQGPGLAEMLRALSELNAEIGTSDLLLPGILAQTVDPDWLEFHRAVIEEAFRLDNRLPMMLTICLSAEVLSSEEQVHRLLEESETWEVPSYYLVCEHTRGTYFVEDPNWLANALDLVAGLKLLNREVLLGYCNQQMLIAASAGADAIASGTWMNVRSFPPEKFRLSVEDERKQRRAWYYCAPALSEFTLPFLDIAFRQGVLDEMAPTPMNEYVAHLFRGDQPTTVRLAEQDGFRHYLTSLRDQARQARANTFDATADAHDELLDTADEMLSRLHAVGVRGQNRDFSDMIDVNRSALSVHRANRGPQLRRHWA